MVEEKKEEKVVNERASDVEEATKQLKELMEQDTVRKLLDNNEIEFKHNDQVYKVRKPTYNEKQEVYKERCERQIELLQETKENGDFKYLSEIDLKKLYLKRGINIDEINKQITSLRTQEKDLLFKLGKAIKEDNSDKQIELYKKDVEVIREKLSLASIERTSLLEFSIEHQVLIFVYSYYTILVTEKKEGDTWVRVWNSIDEMNTGENNLVTQATTYTTIIINDQIQ